MDKRESDLYTGSDSLFISSCLSFPLLSRNLHGARFRIGRKCFCSAGHLILIEIYNYCRLVYRYIYTSFVLSQLSLAKRLKNNIVGFSEVFCFLGYEAYNALNNVFKCKILTNLYPNNLQHQVFAQLDILIKKCKYTARYSLIWKENSIFALSNTPRCRKTCLGKKKMSVLRHVAEKGGEDPWELPMPQVKCALYCLREKGLIYCIVNFDEAVDARLTLWGSRAKPQTEES